MNPLLKYEPSAKSISVRLEELKHAIKIWFAIFWIRFMHAGPGQLLRLWFEQKIKRGEMIWLDDLELSQVSPEQRADIRDGATADMVPNRTKRPRKSRIMKMDAYPEPDYPFGYRTPPISGNVINGLGVTWSRPVRKVFHSNTYRVAWGGLERYYHAIATTESARQLGKIRWIDRHRHGQAASVRYNVDEPDKMAEHVRDAAKQFGAELVGITHLSAEDTFEHFDPSPYSSAICIGVSMDLEGLHYATTDKATMAVMDAYTRAAAISLELAKRIRALGWEALAAGNLGSDTADVLHLPLAVRAGLGQLGKHGSLISKELGANLRLATVLTNMPLAHDKPVDIGVDDFCIRCQVCVTNCPPQAIFDTKQMVRGVEKWYVDFDKCAPYFADHNSCGICLAVCPWTEPGRGESISLKMLAKRRGSPEVKNN